MTYKDWVVSENDKQQVCSALYNDKSEHMVQLKRKPVFVRKLKQNASGTKLHMPIVGCLRYKVSLL